MGTAVVILILIIVCILGIKSYAKKLASGCCGSGGEKVKKKKVEDKKEAHYPYRMQMKIDGMVCGNCATRVENSLNALEGVWASVDLGRQTATVRMKQKIEEKTLKDAVRDAGYTVIRAEYEKT